ncbi:hypothetical protein [Thauera aromatica]|uniref:hypothetical protein n=1 Tax=Thauera aromatica TaxID=59405 RepID=UPI001FFD53FF|nr:hypothetical protein [Thauera aromatica]MCK2097340.1 hypothetical protein [Thauera aromatica]
MFEKKTLRFVGSSLDDLKNFPAEARREAGFERDAVQRGLMPSEFKPMLAVGAGGPPLQACRGVKRDEDRSNR